MSRDIDANLLRTNVKRNRNYSYATGFPGSHIFETPMISYVNRYL